MIIEGNGGVNYDTAYGSSRTTSSEPAAGCFGDCVYGAVLRGAVCDSGPGRRAAFSEAVGFRAGDGGVFSAALEDGIAVRVSAVRICGSAGAFYGNDCEQAAVSGCEGCGSNDGAFGRVCGVVCAHGLLDGAVGDGAAGYCG